MSQNDTPQQGILGVRSFALQQFESDSEASSVRSSGIDSPPLERKPEEKDSARRATLAALGLVVGPPPPVQQQQQQQQPSTSPSVTPGGVSPIGSRSPQSRSPRELPPPGHPSAAVGDLRRPNSPTQSVWAGSFSPDSKQSGSSFSPSASRGISSTNSVVDNDANRSSVYNREERMSSNLAQHRSATNHTGSFTSAQRSPINVLHEVEASTPFLSSSQNPDRAASAAAQGSSAALPGSLKGQLHSTADSAAERCTPTSLVPGSPFQAVQGIELAEPFVAPAVPPIRTKAPTMSPSSTSARHSSRFTERFTSPTTKRIVDELLDEVVAHRLTPRDSSAGTGRQNEPPVRLRGRGTAGDETDLPRMVKQVAEDPQRGGGGSSAAGVREPNSFRDTDIIPPGIAASAQAIFSQSSDDLCEGNRASSRSPSSHQALSEERSSSIGEELKMVMKSERGGRLARDSAEILAGDRPGEFTVVTEEGSAIPVAVKDLSSDGSSPSARSTGSRAAERAGSTGSAGAAAEASSGKDNSSMRTWWGSVTAALGLQSTAEVSGAEASAAAEHVPEGGGTAAQCRGSAAEGQSEEPAAPPVVDVTAEQTAAAPTAVSAFANEVAVRPVSAQTADPGPVTGANPLPASAVESPPVAEVSASHAEPPETAQSAFQDALPLGETRGPPSKPSHISAFHAAAQHADDQRRSSADEARAAPLQPAEGPRRSSADEFRGAFGLSDSRATRRATFPFAAIPGAIPEQRYESPFYKEAMKEINEGIVKEPSHRVSLDLTGPAAEGTRLGALLAAEEAKEPAQPQPAVVRPQEAQLSSQVTAERTSSEAAFLEAMPLELPVKKKKQQPRADPVPQPPPPPPPPAGVPVERTRSEIAYEDAMPLERSKPRSRQQQQPPPPAQQDANAAAGPSSPEGAATWENAVPLERTRRKIIQGTAAAVTTTAGPAAETQLAEDRRSASGGSDDQWEQAAPLERSSRKGSRSMPVSPTSKDVAANPSPRAAQRQPELPARIQGGSVQRASAPADDLDDLEISSEADLNRSDSLDQRLPLMANLCGRYSLESSGTERYDLYIDRAAAYAKAQERARQAAQLAGRSPSNRQSSLVSLDSAAATAFATARRMPHMGGIAAGTQPQALMTVREGLPGDSEPDIDLTEEPETPASETDSEDGGDEAAGSAEEPGQKIQDLVGVSSASPPPSAFASAQPPRSVFADAQLPASDSETEPENGPTTGATAGKTDAEIAASTVKPDVSQAEGKLGTGNGLSDIAAGPQGQAPPSLVPGRAKKSSWLCSCFGGPATR